MTDPVLIRVRLKDGSLVEAKHYAECLVGGLNWPVCALAAGEVHEECRRVRPAGGGGGASIRVVRVIEPATLMSTTSAGECVTNVPEEHN